jgi:hypothetical protein
MTLEIIPYSTSMRGEWNKLCDESPGAWFWHTREWLDYSVAYRPDLQARERSFLVTEGSKVQALMSLLVEHHPQGAELSFGGGYGPALAIGAAGAASDGLRQRVEEAGWRAVDGIAWEEGALRARFAWSPLAPGGGQLRLLPLLAWGAVDTSLATQVIDLSLPLHVLERGMRKGHRADVKRAGGLFTLQVLHGPQVATERLAAYQAMHARAAGRVTRAQSTFDMMFDWVRRGFAALVEASRDGEPVGFMLLFLHGAGAYYGSGCTDPGAIHLPVGHALQWAAITWLKEHGYARYETGWQQYGPLPHDIPSAKEVNIARFKRGFGGDPWPLYRAERYYDAAFYRQVAAGRAEAYAAALSQPGDAGV